jgi:hypothetical protein
MQIRIDLSRGGVQTSVQVRQGDRVGRAGRALLDTGSSRMILRKHLLPDPIAVEPMYDGYVHFMRDALPARIVRLRARLRLGGVDLTGDQERDLQIAVLTDATLPHGVDAVLGLCVPIVRAPLRARFVDVFEVCQLGFAFNHGVLTIQTTPPSPAEIRLSHPLLSESDLRRVDPTATNVHYALSTQQVPRVIFDTGAAHTIVPSSTTALELSGRVLAFGSPVTWQRVGGGVGIVLGMDTLSAIPKLMFVRRAADTNAWRIGVE